MFCYIRFPELFSSSFIVLVFLLLLTYSLKSWQIKLQMSFGFPNHNLALGECLYSFCIIPLPLLMFLFCFFHIWLWLIQARLNPCSYMQTSCHLYLIFHILGWTIHKLRKSDPWKSISSPRPFLCLAASFQDHKRHHNSGVKTSPSLHIPDQFIICCNCEIQQSRSLHQLLSWLCQEIVNNALQKPPIWLELCCVFPQQVSGWFHLSMRTKTSSCLKKARHY